MNNQMCEPDISKYINEYIKNVSSMLNKGNGEFVNNLNTYINYIIKTLSLIKKKCVQPWLSYNQRFIEKLAKDFVDSQKNIDNSSIMENNLKISDMNNNKGTSNQNNNNIDITNPNNLMMINNNFHNMNNINMNNMNNNINMFPQNNMDMNNPLIFNNMGMISMPNQMINNNIYLNNTTNIMNKMNIPNSFENNMIKNILNENEVGNFERDYETFSLKDIQNQNSDIVTDILTFSSHYIKDNEKKENESVGKYLMKIAIISRKSLKDSIQFIYLLINEYKLIKDIKDNNYEKELKKNISSFAKTIEYNIEKNINNFINYFSNFEEKDFFKKLYKKLFKLYFQCILSDPPIELNFKNEKESFDSDEMKDFLNIKGSKKVNFVYLSSLYSEGNYLENGQQWVFAYKEDEKTFFYKEKELKELKQLNNYLEKQFIRIKRNLNKF